MTAEQDPRYPIGRFTSPASWDGAQVAQWRADIAALPGELRAVVAGLDDAALDTPYREGGWTVRQLVHHVADSHLNAYTRLKLALTEENPIIKPYDQDAWAALPDSRLAPVEMSLVLIDGLHARWAALLGALQPGDLERTFIHPDREGLFPLGRMLALYVWHGHHHVAHIRVLRDLRGW